MIRRMQELKDHEWEKCWITGGGGLPCNASGRTYSASNSFFLMLLSAEAGYRYPVFLTAKQANDAGARILKGSRSFPVYYWNIVYKDENGKTIPPETVKKMSVEELAKIKGLPFFKYYNVFNIDQTNLQEVAPEKYKSIVARFQPLQLKDTEGMYKNDAIDRMVSHQEWLCPIHAEKVSDKAYYSPSRDIIVVPVKAQFNKGGSPDEVYTSGMAYYGTMLHEMTHSTLTEKRLNRTGGAFGDAKYAREELVAEMTSALIGSTLGFKTELMDNSAAYLDSWMSVLKQEPKFLMTIMSDVNKAADMIICEIDKQRVALGQEPVKNNKKESIISENENWKVSIFSTPDGQKVLSANLNGEYLGRKAVSDDNFKLYVGLEESERTAFGISLAKKMFAEEISQTQKQEQNRGLKI